MIYNVTKGHIMQKLAKWNPVASKYTYSYNWIGESNIPKMVVNDADCPLLKFGNYCTYKAKGVLVSDPTELYVKDESDKTERQATLQNMVKYYSQGNVRDIAFSMICVSKKNINVYNKNNDSSFHYELGKEKTLQTNIKKLEVENVTQTLVSQIPFEITYNSSEKIYDISYPATTFFNGYNNTVFCAGTAIYSGWWYDYRDSSAYPVMYQYYKKILDVYNNNNAQFVDVATKLMNYRAWSARSSANVRITENMCSFPESNDCVALKEVIALFNDLQKSTSATEKKASLQDIDKMYVVKWMSDCFVTGDIVDDKVNYDDRIDYYARIDNNETIVIDWLNKAVDSGQIVFGAESYIKVLCDYTETVEGTPIERAYVYKVPYSFGNFELNIKDLRDTLDVPLFPTSPIKIRLQGNTVMENGETAERNILFFDVEIKTKDKHISDYGEYEASDVYSDTINIGEPPADDEPTEPTDPPTSDDPIDGGDVTTKNGLTTTYALTSANADSLGAFIWSNSNNWFDSLLKVQSDALSNIVSCKLLPFSLSGTGKLIKIGNIDTQVTALEIKSQVIRKSGGSLKLNRYFNNFLDYAPYTKISLFLPFIGFSQIENEYLYDGVSIEYLFDIITGEMLVLLKSKGKTFRTINGSFGIDIPFSSTNKAQIEGSFLSKIAKDVIDVNPIGLLDTYTGIATSRFKTSNSSSPSSVCAYSAPLQCFVTVDRPILNKPSSYNHDVGQKCVGSYYLRNLKGYTEVENIELNCSCTDSEKNEILSLLRSGVYL